MTKPGLPVARNFLAVTRGACVVMVWMAECNYLKLTLFVSLLTVWRGLLSFRFLVLRLEYKPLLQPVRLLSLGPNLT